MTYMTYIHDDVVHTSYIHTYINILQVLIPSGHTWVPTYIHTYIHTYMCTYMTYIPGTGY